MAASLPVWSMLSTEESAVAPAQGRRRRPPPRLDRSGDFAPSYRGRPSTAALASSAKIVSRALQSLVVDFGPHRLVFRCAMLALRRAATRIQRSWRAHRWRRDAMLEGYLTKWTRLQGMIDTVALGERWKRNLAFVRRCREIGLRPPNSKEPTTFLENLGQLTEARSLDKNRMMEVLMQGYLDARAEFVRQMRRAKRHDRYAAMWADLPSFLRTFKMANFEGSGSFSLHGGGPQDGEGFEFSLEECQARYAAVKQHDDADWIRRGGESRAEDIQPFNAFVAHPGASGATHVNGAKPHDGSISAPSTPPDLALSMRTSELVVGDDDPAMQFLRSASKRALSHTRRARHVKFGAQPKQPLDYDELPSTGSRREEKMLWTNDLSRYPRMRVARDASMTAHVRRVSNAVEREEVFLRGKRRPSQQHSRSRRNSATATPLLEGALSASTEEALGQRAVDRDTIIVLPVPALPIGDAIKSTHGSHRHNKPARISPPRRETVDPSLTPRTRRSQQRRAGEARRKAIQKRHLLAHRPLSADVTFISTDGCGPHVTIPRRSSTSPSREHSRTQPSTTTQEPQRRMPFPRPASAPGNANTFDASSLPPRPSTRQSGRVVDIPPRPDTRGPRPWTPSPSVAAMRLLPRPATAAGSSGTANRVSVGASEQYRPSMTPVFRDLSHPAQGVEVRPASAAVGRMPPHRVHDVKARLNRTKAAATYSHPEAVARLLGAEQRPIMPPWMAGLVPRDTVLARDPELTRLCRHITHGDQALEAALRREWEEYRHAAADSPAATTLE
jgi:hypothetical protein